MQELKRVSNGNERSSTPNLNTADLKKAKAEKISQDKKDIEERYQEII